MSNSSNEEDQSSSQQLDDNELTQTLKNKIEYSASDGEDETTANKPATQTPQLGTP